MRHTKAPLCIISINVRTIVRVSSTPFVILENRSCVLWAEERIVNC